MVQSMSTWAAAAGRGNLAQIFIDIQNYHTTPEQAAETARDAGVDYLLLTHIVPPLPLPGMHQVFLGDAPQIFNGTLRIGQDGDFLSLLVDSQTISLSKRL
jgi:ribonuclease Z